MCDTKENPRLKLLGQAACIVGKPFTTFYKEMLDTYDERIFDTDYVARILRCIERGELLTGRLAEYVGCNIFGDADGDLSYAAYLACDRGHFRLLRWLHKHHDLRTIMPTYRLHCHTAMRIYPKGFLSALFVAACGAGHMKCAKWLVLNIPGIDVHAWRDKALTDACIAGHLETAQWLYSTFCFVDVFRDNYLVYCETSYNGRLDVLQWMLSISPLTLYYLKKLWRNGCRGNRIKIVQWLETHYVGYNVGYDVGCIREEFHVACEEGNSRIVIHLGSKLLDSNVIYITELLLSQACAKSETYVALWLLQNVRCYPYSCRSDEERPWGTHAIFKEVCERGPIETFKLMLPNYITNRYIKGTEKAVVRSGRYEILIAFLEMCPDSIKCISLARLSWSADIRTMIWVVKQAFVIGKIDLYNDVNYRMLDKLCKSGKSSQVLEHITEFPLHNSQRIDLFETALKHDNIAVANVLFEFYHDVRNAVEKSVVSLGDWFSEDANNWLLSKYTNFSSEANLMLGMLFDYSIG